MELVDDIVLERCAKILGPSSAAASALTHLRYIRAQGERAVVYLDQRRKEWIIQPPLSQPASGHTDIRKENGPVSGESPRPSKHHPADG